MREHSRGGSLVAATIAALNHRSGAEDKPRPAKSRASALQNRNVPTISEETFDEERSRRASAYSERPLSTASEASERDSASVQSSEELPPHEST